VARLLLLQHGSPIAGDGCGFHPHASMVSVMVKSSEAASVTVIFFRRGYQAAA
jgi:hypothetical protein